MAGRYVYNAAGQKVWTEDGGLDSAQAAGGGIAPTTTGIQPGGKVNHGWRDLPNFEENKEIARRMWESSGNAYQMNAAQADPVAINRAAEMETRAKQYEMLRAYDAMAGGGGPSVAGHMTREGLDATGRAMMSAPGGMRAALAGGSAMGADAAMKGASMKAGEQQGAWGALTSGAAGVRGADIAGNTEEAKLSQQIGLANAGFRQQAATMNQDSQLAALANRVGTAGMYGGLVADNAHANIGYDQMGRSRVRANNAYQMAKKDRDDAATAQAVNMLATMGVAASDERVKKDVAPGDGDLAKFYDSLSAYEYEYKDPEIDGASPGKHVSVMAQDLEKSEIGKRAVSESEEGHKMVNYAKLLPVQVAATAWLHKRLDKIEKTLTKSRSR